MNEQSKAGVSRARVRQALRANVRPAPLPLTISAAVGTTDQQLTVKVMNLTPDTGLVFVPDQAAADETASAVISIVPSTASSFGVLSIDVDFVNLPGVQLNLFQMFLTGPNGQRVFLGTVNGV